MGCGISKTNIQPFSRQISDISNTLKIQNVCKNNNVASVKSDDQCLKSDISQIDKMESSEQHPSEDTNKQSDLQNGVPATDQNNDVPKDTEEQSTKKPVDTSNEQQTGEGQTIEGQGQDVKQPKKLTPEEAEEKIKKKTEELQEIIASIMSEEIYNEDGIPSQPFRQKMLDIGKLYYALKAAPRKYNERYKQESGQIFCKTDFIDFVCKYIIDTLDGKKYKDSDGKTVIKFHNALKNGLTMVLNYSDALFSICERICNIPGFLDSMRSTLEAIQPGHFEREGTVLNDEDRLIKTILGIIHNIGMSESCVSYLRKHDFTPILIIYMDSRLAMCRLSSIASLADIVDEEESGLLQAKPSGIKFLIKIFAKSLKNEHRKELGWSSWELGRSVGRLARNDGNKKMLAEQGALPLLVELSNSDDLKEEKVALESLWVLTFDEDNKVKILEEDGLMEMVVEKHRNSSDKIIRKACQGILWNLRELLKLSEKYSDIGKEFSGSTSSPAHKKAKGHLMISYQWANQDILKQIRDSLKQSGYSVWMDIDNMGGSTLQAMAEAIENASVVLICMSRRYKDSPNCRAEAEYAFSQRKEIVPLLMESGYRPDGWLGMILGAKLFFDFSGKYSYDSRIEGLKKEVKQRLGESERGMSEDVVDAGPKQQPVVAEKAPGSFRTPPVAHSDLDDVKQWNSDDVKKWLTKYNLKSDKLNKLTGREVAFLKTVRYEAPEFFFRTLETKLGLSDLLGLVNFTEAMDNLTK